MQFSQIRGQTQALFQLTEAIRHNHISHCYLFSGPEGVGKKQTALAFAQYLCCHHPSSTDSCDLCPACIQMRTLSHPDVSLISADGLSIKIQQVKHLSSKLALRSYEGRYKVVLFDDAHLLTEDAANSLLKLLEEPAAETVFILITSQPQHLPSTILSRCVQVLFQPLSAEHIAQIMTAQLSNDAHLAPEECRLFAALANGSVSRAMQMLHDKDFSQLRRNTYDLAMHLPDTHISDIILWCATVEKSRDQAVTILTLLQFWYRDLLLCLLCNEPQHLYNDDYLTHYQTILDAASPQQAKQLTDILSLLQEHRIILERNVSPRLTLEVTLLMIRNKLMENTKDFLK